MCPITVWIDTVFCLAPTSVFIEPQMSLSGKLPAEKADVGVHLEGNK